MDADVLDYWVDAASVPVNGKQVRFAVSADGVAELVRINDLLALGGVAADVSLMPQADDNILAIIHFTAQVTQKCVVSLEPVVSDIDETVRLLYTPEAALHTDGLDLDLDEDEDEDREALIDGKINLGAAVAEHFALALDPYPRRPGVTLPEGTTDDGTEEDVRDNPFAVLERLKRDKHS